MTHPSSETLMAWCDGELDAAAAAAVAAHLADCATCRAVTDDVAAVSARLRTWTVEPAPASLRPAATAPASRGTHRWWWAAAAAAVLIGVLASVRVECAPACDPRTVHFALPGRGASPSSVSSTSSTSSTSSASSATPPPAQTLSSAFEAEWLARPSAALPSAPGARVTVVMFLDWQCPACRAAERAYAPVFEEFSRQQPGAVHVEVRDYPLNRRCNPYVPVEMHSAACEAAAAVRLARPNGTADALIAWLFANQEQLTPAAVRSAAATVGHITDFDARLAGTLREVASDVALGHGVGVGGTPTCFINGVLARNDGGTTLFRPEEIRRAIAIELKK